MPVSDTKWGTMPEQLKRVAQEYADLFTASSLEEIDHLIADACVDPYWDDRTNLLSLLAEGPEDLGLVLSNAPDEFVVVRYIDREVGWVADYSPVDWDELEDRAFDPGPEDADCEGSAGYEDSGAPIV